MPDERFSRVEIFHSGYIAVFLTVAPFAAFLVEAPVDLVESFQASCFINHSLTMLLRIYRSMVTGD